MGSHAWMASSFVLRYISSQLSDKTDKSATRCPHSSSPILSYALLSSLLLLCFYFIFLNYTLLELTVLFEIDLPVICTFKHQMLPQRPRSIWHFPPSRFFNE